MKFNRWILNNRSNSADDDPDHGKTAEQISTHHPPLAVGSQKSIYERALYFISFPFDVNLGEVFGFGTYGQHWIIEEYDGATRAANGYWLESDPNWKFIFNRKNRFFEPGVGYIIALALSFLVPKIYTAIAFDSGGVASGPMTSTFVLPFCIGFSYSTLQASGEEVTTGSIYQYGFGLVALVALMPLIILQLVGLYAQIRKAVLYRQARRRIVDENDDQIIHFGKEEA